MTVKKLIDILSKLDQEASVYVTIKDGVAKIAYGYPENNRSKKSNWWRPNQACCPEYILEIRNRYDIKMHRTPYFVIKNFRHPVSAKHYALKYSSGAISVTRLNKSHEIRFYSPDTFLNKWLYDDTIPNQFG